MQALTKMGFIVPFGYCQFAEFFAAAIPKLSGFYQELIRSIFRIDTPNYIPGSGCPLLNSERVSIFVWYVFQSP
jgi:hypothetical protein